MTASRYFTGQHWWQWGHWLILLGALLIWWWLSEALASTIFLPLWIGVAQIIFAGSLEAAMLRRRAWLGQYLKKASPWHRWLHGGLVMVIWHQLIGVTLALILLVSLRQLAVVDGLLLLITLVLFIAYGNWLHARLEKHVIADYLPAVTRRLLVPFLASILALGLAIVTLWRPQPYLVGVSWETAINNYLVAEAGQSVLGAFERIDSALELSSFWAMQNAIESLGIKGPVAVLGWGVLLLMQGALAWSFLRTLAGVAALHHRLVSIGKSHKTLNN